MPSSLPLRRASTLAVTALLCASPLGAASAAGFKLVLSTKEPRIEKGALRETAVVKSYPLKPELIARSKRLGRLSTSLFPRLNNVFNAIDARTPKEAYFVNDGGRWIARQQTGWTVDRAATKANLLKAAKAGKDTAEIVLKLTEPGRSVRDWAKRGILFHVAGGSSNFAGSPPFRVQNISVGAKKLEERYVEPGEEFDFNAYVGEIDRKNGFVPGYVIAGGTLSKEDGGGICQVSATIFRAAYQGGFPITERHEHSHRVRYYDPVGYEATVYAPTKNFKFKNDTKAPLFIQATMDRANNTLRFDLFGARPDRKVTVSRPVVTNFKPAAKPSFSADPNVAPGRARQVDVPSQGMTVRITRRIVTKDGKVRKDRTVSVYKPWGAVYAVNPGDRRVRAQTSRN